MKQTKIGRLFFLLFILCIFTLSLGQFSTVITFSQGNIYLFDALIALFDFLGLLYLAKHRQLTTPLSIIFPLTLFALGIVSLLFSALILDLSEFLTSLAYSLRFFSYILFALVTWNFSRLGFFQVDKMYRVIIYSGLFLFLAGLIQLTILPDLETLNPLLGWDPHKNRMVSTFFDPNFLGMYFVMCLATALKFISYKKAPKISTAFPYHTNAINGELNKHLIFSYLSPIRTQSIGHLYSVIFLVGILLTFSRSAWLATAVLIFFAGLKNKTLLLTSALIILLAIFAVPRVQTRISGITDPQDSASFRLVSWRNTWEIIKDNWVFGVGYNAFRYAQRDYGFLDESTFASRSGAGSDSSLLLVWATSGIFGLIFFVCFFVLTLLRSIKSSDLITIGLLFAILVDSVFINSLFYPQIIVLYLLFFIAQAWRRC